MTDSAAFTADHAGGTTLPPIARPSRFPIGVLVAFLAAGAAAFLAATLMEFDDDRQARHL